MSRIKFSAYWTAPGVAFLLVFLLGLRVHCQGFNLLDDGLWVLGTRVIADGGVLYRDLFTIYGPARYYFVLPFFLLAGKSVLGLALAKAFSDGLAAAVGVWGTRSMGAGRWVWLIPLGVIALGPIQPRYVAAATLAFLVAKFMARGMDFRRGILLGLGWGGLALFGLDMAGYGAVILGLGFLVMAKDYRTTGIRSLAPWSGILIGAGAVLTVILAVVWAQGNMGDMFWDTVIYPVTRFRGAMGSSWLHDFGDSDKLGILFPTLFTGEVLHAAWTGQAVMRIISLRALYILIWLLPAAGILKALFFHRPTWAPVVGLALAGWATLLGRGDPSHLALAWYGSLVLAPLLISDLAAWRKSTGIFACVFLVVVAAPLFMGNVWLAAHLGRSSLKRWELPTARIYMGAKRIPGLEKILHSVPSDPHIPLLTWPIQPGLTFLNGSALATFQTTLLAGEVRNPERVIADLQRTKPQCIIQGRSSGVIPGIRSFRGLAPSIYPFVRTHYTVAGTAMSGRESYQILARHDGDAEEIAALPLKEQLPTASQQLSESYTPPIVGAMSVVQTLRVREFGLHGMVFKLSSPGPYPSTVSVRLTVMEMLPSGKAVVRLEKIYPVELKSELELVEFRFPEVPDSVGKTMGVMISNGKADGPEFRVVWNMPTDGSERELDYYPEGYAILAGERIWADLYFLAY